MYSIQAFAKVFAERVGPAYESDGFLWRPARPLSDEVVSTWHSLHRLGWRLARRLEERYGLVFSGPCLGDPRFGPPSTFFGMTRGLTPEESADVWLDAWCAHQGNREVQQAVLAAWEALVMGLPGGWEDPRVPRVRTVNTMTARQRRRCLSLLSQVRSQFLLPEFYRRADACYQQLLRVWDAREGWTGEGYEAVRAVKLRTARLRSGANAKRYYQAFQLVIGAPYSGEKWEGTLGARHQQQLDSETYRKLEARPHRRRTGRPKGARQRAPGKVTLSSPPAQSSLDPSSHLQQQELCEQLQRFLQRVEQGVPVQIAAAELELPRTFLAQLVAPDGLDLLRQHFERTNSGNEEG
jgi:hypothetical protein